MKFLITIAMVAFSFSSFADSILCRTDIGGNILSPKSKLLCTVNALGAVSYEVRVNNKVQWTGKLKKNIENQNFVTSEKKVGGKSAEYKVFLINAAGAKSLTYIKNPNFEESYTFDLTPVTGSCVYDIGGNFFKKKTKVLCSVIGKGVVGYEIKVNNSVQWNGKLNPTLDMQDFKTSEKTVGGSSVSYVVYAIDNLGYKTLISEQYPPKTK
jgi:hypothetical protein